MPRKGDFKPQRVAGDTSRPDSLGTLLRMFLESLRARHYSPETVTRRRRDVGDLVEWLEARDLVRPADITREHLERYQAQLARRTDRNGVLLSIPTQHTRLTSIRGWFKWLARGQYVMHNPASELELPKTGHRLPKHILSARQVEEVLAEVNVDEPLGVRDRSILETFYSSGLRRHELVALALGDVDTDRGVLRVQQGKGRKDRVIPIGARALAWLEKYRHEVRPRLLVDAQERALYLTRYGKPFSDVSMSVLVRDYVRRALPDKSGSCHLLRHAMATAMLEGGADIRFIQAMLGHASLSTTQIYTQVSIQKLKEIHAATHPARHVDAHDAPGAPPRAVDRPEEP